MARIGVLLLLMATLFVSMLPAHSQEKGHLLIGYGGGKYLPFLEGATYTFLVGERLVVAAVGRDISITLSLPDQGSFAFLAKGGESQVIREFRKEDKGIAILSAAGMGSATIRVLEIEEAAAGWISIVRVADQLLELSVAGSALSGFEAAAQGDEPARLVVSPGSTVRIIPPDRTLYARILLRYAEDTVISGYVSGVYLTYSSESLVAEYSFNGTITRPLRGPLTVSIPNLSVVGAGGFLPLRYGSLKMVAQFVTQGAPRREQTWDLVVSPIPEPQPSLTPRIRVDLAHLLSEGVAVVTANLTKGEYDRRIFKPPHYRVAVYDEELREYVNDYSITVPGFLSIRNGSETILMPSLVPVIGEEPESLKVVPDLTVYSVSLSRDIEPLMLDAQELTVVRVRGREVGVEVRLAAGYPVTDAVVYVNGSLVGSGSRLRLKLPLGVYNFSAQTQYGYVSETVDVRESGEVQLVLRVLTPDVVALIMLLSVQLFYLAMHTLRLRGGLMRPRAQSR
jgi:hypothetical protein